MMEYADPAPDIVVRFDEGERFPGVTVFGLFLARAVRPPNDETFDTIDLQRDLMWG
jgi:hypothetical protein